MNQYIGVRDLSKKVVRQYIGVGGVAKRVYKAYVGGPGNIPRLYYKDKYWLNVPTVSGTYTYDGTTQTVSFTGLDTDLMTVSGVTSGTDAGTYNAIISLNDTDNYAWMDETTGPKTVPWTIGKQSLAVPTVTGTYTYNMNAQTPTVEGYDNTLMTEGTKTATNAGWHNIAYTLIDQDNYKWPNTSSATAYASWYINKKYVAKPTLNGTVYTWDKTGKHVPLTGEGLEWYSGHYTSKWFVLSGDIWVYDAGSFYTTASINDPSNIAWEGGSTESVTYQWTVNRGQIAVSTQDTTVTMRNTSQHYLQPVYGTATINITLNGSSQALSGSIPDATCQLVVYEEHGADLEVNRISKRNTYYEVQFAGIPHAVAGGAAYSKATFAFTVPTTTDYWGDTLYITVQYYPM